MATSWTDKVRLAVLRRLLLWHAKLELRGTGAKVKSVEVRVAAANEEHRLTITALDDAPPEKHPSDA